MIDKTMRIGVIKGGLSAERPVSLESGAAVARALRRRGYDVVEVDATRDLPRKLVAEGVQAAWIALHGRFGEDGCVQGLLEVMGIPYTGSGVRASSVAMDKVATKRVAAALGGDVVLASDWTVRRGEALPTEVDLPVFVKPSVGGSTLGAMPAHTLEELEVAVREAHRFHDEALIEEVVEGDEITVAVLDGRALPVVRIVPKSGLFDYEAKYTKGLTEYEVPGAISESAAARASVVARVLYRALQCRGLCRVDFIVRARDDLPVLLELNTIPGMTEMSLSPMAAAATGIGFDELVEQILLAAQCMPPEVEP